MYRSVPPMQKDTVPTVTTVTGPVDVNALGRVMVHEHVVFDLSHYAKFGSREWDDFMPTTLAQENLWWFRTNPMGSVINLVHTDRVQAIHEIEQFKRVGGATLVDVSSLGLGSDPQTLHDVARATGVNIVAGTGFYIDGSYPSEYTTWSRRRLGDHLRTELAEGIQGTTVRAGVIGEIGISNPVIDFEHRLLGAIADVQTDLNTPVTIHPAWGPAGVTAAMDAAEAAGVDPRRTVISHLDNRLIDDIGAFVDVADRGFHIALDCFGRDAFYPHANEQLPSDAVRIATVMALVEAGLTASVMLSQDICYRHELVANGGHGYGHVIRTVVPRLRSNGVSDAAIEEMLVHNPARWLTGA